MIPACRITVSVPATNYYSFITFLKSKRGHSVKSVVITGVHIEDTTKDKTEGVFAYRYDLVVVGDKEVFVAEMLKTELVPQGEIWAHSASPISIIF